MKKFLLVALTFHAIFFSAQKKNNCEDIINKWNTIGAFSQPSIESVKKCISKDERKIKIEVINRGDYKDLYQILYLEFKKVNNNDFSPILKYSEHTPNIVVDETYDKINWRGEGGAINEHTIFVFQGYSGVESNPNIPLKEIEIYETTAPVLSGILRIMGTYRKDFNHNKPTNLTKIINIYSDGKLLISKEYEFSELERTGGITIEFNSK
jgi:hypothetical protein